ncbi:peptidoglycan-binding protein [Streptomyces sp. NPDC092296]|uniref:peptidoglycan-binding protein n=1 Tax=Streptomyces sp. NPDC092296 TaxID=3366012 RepID=UPI00382F469D
MSGGDEQTTGLRTAEPRPEAPETAGGGQTPTRAQHRWLRWPRERKLPAALVAGVVLLASGAVAAWLTVGGPGGVRTATVLRRALDGSVTARGTVTPAQTVQVTVPTGGRADAVRAVVTKLPVRPGQTVAAGRVLVEISGRPVFALPGALPAYRDLRPGDHGQDVLQLQKALRGLGLRTGGDQDADFGTGTAAALTALYTGQGYQPQSAQTDGGARQAAAEEAVTAARRDRQDAQDALEAARQRAANPVGGGGLPGADRIAADQAVRAAERRVARGGEDLAAAKRRLAAAKAADGPMLPASEVQYLQGFPATVDSVAAEVGSVLAGSAMTVSADGLVVRSGLPAYQRGLVRPGQTVRIVSDTDRVSASGTVVSVADTPGTVQQVGTASDSVPAASGGSYPMVVRPNQELDPGLAAKDVRVTVQAAPSRGRVLAVPAAALATDRYGRTSVVRYRDGGRHRVEVRTGTSGGGWTEIRPLDAGALREGDRVVVADPAVDGDTPSPVAPAPASVIGLTSGAVPGRVTGAASRTA